MKKRWMVLLLYCLGVCLLGSCAKEGSRGGKALEETGRLVAVYGEIGERHNAFLSRSFLSLREKLAQPPGPNDTESGQVEESALRRLVLEVASHELVPVLGGGWPSAELLRAMKTHLPADLTLEKYASTYEAAAAGLAGIPGASLSPVFRKALGALDFVLQRCGHYTDSLAVFAALDSLLQTWPDSLARPAERESFIAGLVLAKHSFRYWAANEKAVMAMFADTDQKRWPPGVVLTAGGNGSHASGNPNLVKADVRGMVTGGLRGAYAGGIWGSTIPGIGTVWGAVAGGLVGAGTAGCVSSLVAGLKEALTK